MGIELKDNGEVAVTMDEYIEECMEAFGEELNRRSVNPAKGNLFSADEDEKSSKLLNDEIGDVFHHIVAKLLFVAKRSRIDVDLAVSYLCTRVSSPTEGDWDKLRRVLTYLKMTLGMPSILGANGLEVLQTWVDASYAVHRDMKSHTGGVMSLRTGIFHRKSRKQKLHTKSSTEAELVGTSDYLAWTLWAKRFLEEQGFICHEIFFYQDNESAIKLKKW